MTQKKPAKNPDKEKKLAENLRANLLRRKSAKQAGDEGKK
jgi:hypothetical protein